MPFQVPPVLPDYSKLVAVLNQSGLQKANPPTYQILLQLIQAVQQSQNAIVGGNVTNISGGGITSVAVDPNGAIIGDGVGIPLACQVDGTTIQIIGDTLVATSGLVAFGVSAVNTFGGSVAGPGGFTVPPNTQLLLVSGVPGFVIVPFRIYVSAHQDDNSANNALWSPTTSCEVVYNTTGFPVIATGSATIFSAAVGTHNQTSINDTVASLVAGATLDAYLNKDVIVRTNNTINCVSTANKFINNVVTTSLAYLLVPG